MGEMGWREGKWFIGMKMTLHERRENRPVEPQMENYAVEMEESRAERGQRWNEGRQWWQME